MPNPNINSKFLHIPDCLQKCVKPFAARVTIELTDVVAYLHQNPNPMDDCHFQFDLIFDDVRHIYPMILLFDIFHSKTMAPITPHLQVLWPNFHHK